MDGKQQLLKLSDAAIVDASLQYLRKQEGRLQSAEMTNAFDSERSEIFLDAVWAYCQWVADEIEHGEWLVPQRQVT